MNKVYLLLGGNVGDRIKSMGSAISAIEAHVGKVLQKSSMYETKAWGKKDQRDFLNQAISVETGLSPRGLLDKLLDIEQSAGRVRDGKKWSERIIDIDILFFFKGIEDGKEEGKPVILNDERLKIPHPYIHLRRFTLEPMNEIAPGIYHPVLNKTISELLKECPDRLKVKRISAFNK